MSIDLLNAYFPSLTASQQEQFAQALDVYTEWNQKINVISRNDMDNLVERHFLHSLAIANFIQFKDGTEIMDLGTGGGFPGIPLAIFFPQVDFLLVDSIGKKIKVVNEVAQAIGLKNVVARQARAEEVKFSFDFVVTRAVAPMEDLHRWTRGKIKKQDKHGLPNGIIALKGGNLKDELQAFGKRVSIEPLSQWYKEPFFEEKKLVYLPG
jgi:16S rRNA (guanine527-N7)-methyltransferase